jgi:hypothetical protein
MTRRAGTDSPGTSSSFVDVDQSDGWATNFSRILSSTHSMLFLVCMLVIFIAAAQPITDPDFWWHLKTGQYVFETRSIPRTDIFSGLRFGAEWVTHEWLSEFLMYSIFKTVGFGGLIVFFAAMITGAFWIVYQRCRRLAGHPYVVAFALLLGAAATLPTWGVRPQMFSLLLASVFVSFLDCYARRERVPSIWWLVPVIVLWVNLHAGFALGLVLIALTIAGLLLDWLLLREDSFANAWLRARPLCWLLIVCGAAVALNPNGVRIYSYPFETLTSPAMMQYIEEWKSPDFHNPLFQALAVLMVGTFAALALSSKRVRPGQLLMLAATAWAALRSGRNAPFFVLVAVPLLAEHASALITDSRFGQPSGSNGKPALRNGSFMKLVSNVLLIGIIVAVAVLGVRMAVAKQPAIEAQTFPTAAVDYLHDQEFPQPIFNEYEWGGYLIWKLYPNYRVYIDGRADVYGDDLVKEFLLVNNGRPAWKETLDKRGIRTVLIKADAALASLLRQDNGWQKVFEDKQAVIFVRR